MERIDLKYFDQWNGVKQGIHSDGVLRTIKEGEVWWCGVGKNVGVEIDGKGSRFARPVVILYKLSKYNFIGIPLTSQEHKGSWYVSFTFQDKRQIAVLSQIRTFSVFRTYRRMGTLPETDLNSIRVGLRKLLNL